MINSDHLSFRIGELYILNALEASSPPSSFEDFYDSLSDECFDALPERFSAYKDDMGSASDFLEVYQELGFKGIMLRITCPTVSDVRFNDEKKLLGFSCNYNTFYEDVIYVDRFEDLNNAVKTYNESFIKNVVDRFKP